MGLFNSALDMSGGKPPIPQLVDSDTRLLHAALALLANNGQNGGLAELVECFREAGLQDIIHSWIGAGHNLPVSAEQLQEVLDAGHLRQIAEETGLTEYQAAEQLSELLPGMVDRLTPDGHIPEGGIGNMSALLERFADKEE